MGNKMRNANVDRIRGLAMLLVVLGHTMTGSTVGSESSFLFNIVWSIQMPLFMLISGYVTRYSRTVTSITALINVLKKRTISYLLPWCTWTYLVRGVILGEKNYFDFKWLLWHMDTGYWFLVSIWTISIIFAISSLLAEKLIAHDSPSRKTVGVAFFYLLGMIVLLTIGKKVGLSFLCIKLTVYYMPFFFLGYLFGKLQDKIFGWPWGKKAVELIVVVSLGIWLFFLNRVQLYSIGDDSIGILIRMVASASGCCAVCGLMCKDKSENVYNGGGAGLVRSSFAGGLYQSLSGVEFDSDRKCTRIPFSEGFCTDSVKLSSNTDSGVGSRSGPEQKLHAQEITSGERLLKQVLLWFGTHSLECYLSHGLFLCLFLNAEAFEFTSIMGKMNVLLNFVSTALLVYGSVRIMEGNRQIRYVLFGIK